MPRTPCSCGRSSIRRAIPAIPTGTGSRRSCTRSAARSRSRPGRARGSSGSFTAVAIPPWQEHRVAAHGNASLRSVFVDTDAYPELVTDLVAVHVSELLHELIREAGRHYTDFDGADPVASGVVALIARLLPTDADRATRRCGCRASRTRCCSRSRPRSTAIPPTRRASTSGPVASVSAPATSRACSSRTPA